MGWYICFIDDLVCEEVICFDDFKTGGFLGCVIEQFRVMRVHYKTSILVSGNAFRELP